MENTHELENLSVTQRLEVDLAPLLKEVKISLRIVLREKRDIIIQLGEELLKRINRPEEIYGSIKYILRNEIADSVIAARTIELFCPRDWKKRTKPLKNERISFSPGDLHETKANPAAEILTNHFPEYCQQKACDGTTQNVDTTNTPRQRSMIFFRAEAMVSNVQKALYKVNRSSYFDSNIYFYGRINLQTSKASIRLSGKNAQGFFVDLISNIEGTILSEQQPP
jgi:hypothetical protein